ncbi:hypothetical protein [Shimia sediminis]|uniref:hypothetical protein n=1 Tax=Shimia sediminis TaxID=2497945 RepID=UPI000F8D07ED|nr:hypothetical protein [Shimia sediminis]
MNDVSIFFVADGIKLERKSWVLAVSLRREMGFDFPIIAYVPEQKLGSMSSVSRVVFRRCGVEVRTFDPSKGDWETPYVVGNKILAAKEQRETTHSIFLDTDTVCIQPLEFPRDDTRPYLAAVPEGVLTWGKERRGHSWEVAYGEFGLDVPEQRVTLTRGRNRSVPPYFNAGFVAFREKPDYRGNRLSDVWYDTALRLDRNPDIADKRPWLDQISLPVAAARMNADLVVLDESFNCSLHGRSVDPQIDKRLLHYHHVATFNKWPQCRSVLGTASEWLPDKKRGHLKRHLSRWKFPGDLEEAASSESSD